MIFCKTKLNDGVTKYLDKFNNISNNTKNYSGNLSLIGMPGCGKSTNGVVLAKTLGMSFLDTDLIIQRREMLPLCEIISQKGLDAFLKIEAEAVMSVSAEDTCISTGGSVVYVHDAMMHLKSISKIIYLALSYEEIESRLSDIKGRGVAIEEGKTLKNIYDERIPMYEKYADITIDTRGLTIEQTIEAILIKLAMEDSNK